MPTATSSSPWRRRPFPISTTILDTAKKNAPPLVVTYLDAAKTVRGGTATFNLTAPAMLHVVLDAKDAEAAGNLEDLLQQALRMASGGPGDRQADHAEGDAGHARTRREAGRQFIDGGKATKSGSQVTLDFKRPKILDTAGAADRRRGPAIDRGSPRGCPPGTADEQHAADQPGDAQL